ncbi:MAG: BadF/BadG/BcrA/BcrD ATPase family protein [Actinoallomurus sp.]
MLAVDGGNAKTDVALLTADGALLSWVRGPGSTLGARRAAALIARLATAAAHEAGLDPAGLAGAHAACYLAGADLPWQAEALRGAIAEHGPFGWVEVGNDAWALLRAGAPAAALAVGVVCGAGLKCVARAGADRFEFPSLGWQSGDLSGAGDFLAREAVRAAARAEDGRGPATRLRQAVCDRLAVPTIRTIAERLLEGTLTEDRLGVLAPVVLEHAGDGDSVAAAIVNVLAAEVVAMARAARSHVAAAVSGWTLVAGGGLFADPAGRLLAAVRVAAPGLEKEFRLSVVNAPPVIGAALLGLDHLQTAASADALRRAFRDIEPRMMMEPTR